MNTREPNYEDIKIAVMLRAARVGMGLSQAELANHLQVSQSTIARCERGTGGLPGNVLLHAMGFMKQNGINITDIYTEEPSIQFTLSFFQREVTRIASSQY